MLVEKSQYAVNIGERALGLKNVGDLVTAGILKRRRETLLNDTAVYLVNTYAWSSQIAYILPQLLDH